MIAVYLQMFKVMWIVRRERVKGYATIHLNRFFSSKIYPKTKELLRKRGYVLEGMRVLPESDDPAHWRKSALEAESLWQHGATYSDLRYSCSRCGMCTNKEYDYCPHCGSVMRKELDDYAFHSNR